MTTRVDVRTLMFALVLSGALEGDVSRVAAAAKDPRLWTERFQTSSCTWSSIGRNDFFILEPGDQAVFEGQEGKDSIKLVITVLNETKMIGDVETRIVEERETHNAELVEVSRNFFAVCKPAKDVFYFGEDVDIYKGGALDSHEGSWAAGKAGARPGLFMPARTLLGARFYQEIAPSVAMDRVEILSDSEVLKTPAGKFEACLKTEETTPLEPGVRDYKIYARGVGMIQDGVLTLTKHGIVSTNGSR